MVGSSFDWHAALSYVQTRCLAAIADPTLFQPLPTQGQVGLQHYVEAAQALLLDPRYTLTVANAFRPVLAHLVSAAVESLLEGSKAPASQAAAAVALVDVLALAPFLEGSILYYLKNGSPPFETLVQLHSQPLPHGGSVTAQQFAYAALRTLLASPAARGLHCFAGTERLLLHEDADVRWAAVECVAIIHGLRDAPKQQLTAQVLDQDAAVGASLKWRDDCTRIAVERAALWMPEPPHFNSKRRRLASDMEEDTASVPSAGSLAAPSGFVDVSGILLPLKADPHHAAHGGRSGQIVRTPAVERNLEAAALALCQGRPLLLEGPPGCGKSALLEELAHATGNTDYISVHVDDQMDAKSLLGAYIATSTPGEFHWQPGLLTQAVAEGRWLVIEDVNLAPPDVLAALVPLLDLHELHLPQRAERIQAAPGFQLLATVTCSPGGTATGAYGDSQGVRNMLGGLWTTVFVEPVPIAEQAQILASSFPHLEGLAPLGLAVLHLCQMAGGHDGMVHDPGGLPQDMAAAVQQAMAAAGLRPGDLALHFGRHFSLRDLFKWGRRLEAAPAVTQMSGRLAGTLGDLAMLPVFVREAAFVESADCFAAMIAQPQARGKLLLALAALWGLQKEHVERCALLGKPELHTGTVDLRVGRATLPVISPEGKATHPASGKGPDRNFARTGQVMRVMESVAVAISQQEPVLLVGETGTGKSTLVQYLARQVGVKMVVVNLSQQTDSADLLGGFRPVQAGDALQPLLERFQQLVSGTWTKGNNEAFLSRAFKFAQRRKWSALLHAFRTAVAKVEELDQQQRAHEQPAGGAIEQVAEGVQALTTAPRKRKKLLSTALREEWQQFARSVAAAERAVAAAEGGFAFAFVEGALVKAVREGSWLLLDEINLAPPEALERIAGLLEASSSSIILSERGDSAAVARHPNFRLMAAMNPATDAGKRELPVQLRNRFTEVCVAEMDNHEDLQRLVLSYLQPVTPKPPAAAVVDFYLAARSDAASMLQDGAGSKPTYSLRTLSRALEYTQATLPTYGLQRALYDGASMAFLTQLHPSSAPAMEALLRKHLLGGVKSLKALQHAPAKPSSGQFVQFEQFWVEAGPVPLPEDDRTSPYDRFVTTPSVSMHLSNLARAVLLRRYPILLQGPTSSGKTSLVAHLAARTGHRFVRINNHEGTDLQEYLGSYIADERGHLVFCEGALVTALRQGHWVVLDELNLAPSEVLEALNRLLDDNRELFVPELQEVIKPHPHFMLFATQNPAGAYGGRKTMSRAFRSRFLELHVGDIPDGELATILHQRCDIAPSHANKLVDVMRDLQRRRQGSDVFAGKHGLITPRDLFKWANRGAMSYQELAENGFLLLGERLRAADERATVQAVLESSMKVKLNIHELYSREGEAPVLLLQQRLSQLSAGKDVDEDLRAQLSALQGIVWTRSMCRLYTLLDRCMRNSEAALLVGETGTGKTTVCQLVAMMRGQRLHILNCNLHTEASDFLGGFRPSRNRQRAVLEFSAAFQAVQDSELLRALDIQAPEDADTLAGPDLSKAAQAAAAVLSSVKKALGDQVLDARQQRGLQDLEDQVRTVASAAAAASAPFEWVDGPLVTAMRQGDVILVDELNLAEDAVLERLNSVLESSRTLTLAEKGDAEEITAAPGFRLVATMNPGGDYGKRELSPALANRFTSIWVPSFDNIEELAAILHSHLKDASVRDLVAQRLLDFWQFFHARAGAAKSVLSVRDLLAWAGFINATAPRLGALAAYAHGAHLVLLDGIGLGIGMPLEAARALQEHCKAFLASQLPPENQADAAAAAGELGDSSTAFDAASDDHEQGLDASTRWGISPFWIERGAHAPSTRGFDFQASTTARNAMRVLRALQLRKAVLLEGSPGVGKTSLVAALAKATGRRLVRINLSEQTDMMDLLGADLPAAGGSAGEFAWSDGPLLGALKAGDWVLLDELNLAGQSVLEGLNAMLDHRGEIFIPELGATFRAPEGFRVFAAQNPLQEGGGRRGLPKSFLNRFTRVHVDLLQPEDLVFIASALHPRMSQQLLQRMVALLDDLHSRVNLEHAFGGTGSPWEFNLRDLLRWCDLAEGVVPKPATGNEEGQAAALASAVVHFANTLLLQRLRTPADRQAVRDLLTIRDLAPAAEHRPSVAISAQTLRIGWSLLPRAISPTGADRKAAGQGLQLLTGQTPVLESVAHCIQHSWPCLLVGGHGSGKTSIVHSLAALCGQELTEVALTAGADTSDLLGGFEQMEPRRHFQALVSAAQALARQLAQALLVGSKEHAQADCPRETAPLAARLEQLGGISDSLANATQAGSTHNEKGHVENILQLHTFLEEAEALVTGGSSGNSAALLAQVQRLSAEVSALRSQVTGDNAAETAGRFEWVDGALTRAIEEGRWVLLDNANLCNPTVLDRLNPLLEPEGMLLLNECGMLDGEPRILRPHPNFRLFLTMDPRHGEISRAMRNRCIELSLLPDDPTQPSEVDDAAKDFELRALSLPGDTFQNDLEVSLAAEGVPGTVLPRAMIQAHLSVADYSAAVHEQGPTKRELRAWAALSRTLSERGWSFADALQISWQQVYVRGKPSLDARCAAEEAYLASCTGVSAATASPEDPSQPLVVPAGWPHPVSVSYWAHKADLATVELDAALLEAHLASLSASESAGEPRELILAAAAQSSALAAVLPASLLGAMLQGIQMEGTVDVAERSAVEARARLVWQAGACFAERARPADRSARRLWLEHLVGPMQDTTTTAGTVAGGLSRAVGHQMEHALTSLLMDCHPQLKELLGLSESALSVLPLDPTIVDYAPTLLQAQGAMPEHTSGLSPEDAGRAHFWECVAELARLRRCAWVLHMMSETQAAAAAVEKLPKPPSVASIFQLSSWRAAHPQARLRKKADHEVVDMLRPAFAMMTKLEEALLQHGAQVLAQRLQQGGVVGSWHVSDLVEQLQDVHGRLWHYVHGGLTNVPAAEATATQLQPLIYHWQHLTVTLQNLADLLPQAKEWPIWAQVQQMVDNMNLALGISSAQPAAPLVWQEAGHPSLPASAALCALEATLVGLCNVTRVTAAGSQLDPSGWPVTLQAAGIAAADLLDGATPQVSTEQLGQAVLASLAANRQLRRDLLEGLCLFQLAAFRTQGREPNEESAQEVVALLQKEAVDAARQVAVSVATGASVEAVLQSYQATEASSGSQAQIMPWQLLRNRRARDLQANLLPFLALSGQEMQLPVLAAITNMALNVRAHGDDPATPVALSSLVDARLALAELVEGVLASGVLGIDAAAPMKRLIWLLEGPAELRRGTKVGKSSLEEELPELLHQMWANWHAALHTAPGGSGGHALESLQAGTAARTQLVGTLISGPQATVEDVGLRTLQLRLAARHMRRWSTSEGEAAASRREEVEWQALRVLLAQIVLAFRGALSDSEASEELARWVTDFEGLLAPLNRDGAAGPKESAQELSQGLLSQLGKADHSLLADLLQSRVKPCLDAITAGSLRARHCELNTGLGSDISQQTAGNEESGLQKRGQAWALLGILRLCLVLPVAGVDPALKPTLARDSLLLRLQHSVQPELQVREELQRLPGGKDESQRIAELRGVAAGIVSEAEDLQRSIVPRPVPSQYQALQAELRRFAEGLGSAQRLDGLIARLLEGSLEARQEADFWPQNAAALTSRLAATFPLYRDLLQPVQLAVSEIRYGLSALATSAAQPDNRLSHLLVLLAAFPADQARNSDVDPRAVSPMAAALAPAAASGTAKPSDQAAAFDTRLGILRALLHTVVADKGSASAEVARKSQAVFTALLEAWEGVTAAEAAKAAEEAELFKTKTRESSFKTEEEEAEADYKQRFPDHFAHFAGLSQDTTEMEVDGDINAAAETTQAEASSRGAVSLLRGELLDDIVATHQRLFGPSVAMGDDQAWQADFQRGYDLVTRMAQGSLSELPKELDEKLASGHLLRVCLEHQQLTIRPSDGGGSTVDVQQPAVGELLLVREPVTALLARLRELLEDWPGNPMLEQLIAICTRLLGLPAQAPLKAAMLGAELLLDRAQLWEQSAARHVSIAPQLDRVAAVAKRWRRLELSSWRTMLTRAIAQHAAGTHASWFHLFRLLLASPQGNELQQTASTLEHFLQTATMGEFERRLQMVSAFRGHVLILAEHQEGALQIATLLDNIHKYYHQFVPHMQQAIEAGLAPIEKSLQDFVKLAKWEDRGHYAQQLETEKAQRQLHKMLRNAEAVLGRPAGGVLAAVSAAMGFADLSQPDLVGAEDSSKKKSKKARKAAAAAARTWEDQVAEERQSWLDACAAAASQVAEASASSGLLAPQLRAALRLDEEDLYQHRLPQLAKRLRSVLEDSAVGADPQSRPSDAVAGAQRIDELAGSAAQHALELRGFNKKGARARKKKALVDILRALAVTGASRRRSAVPADERSVHSWFTQSSPAGVLDNLLTSTSQEGRDMWSKADAYYFRSIARMQRLWEAAKSPHQDISSGEAEQAVLLSEHLLHLQRMQRRVLTSAGSLHRGLAALGELLAGFESPADTAITAVTVLANQAESLQVLLDQQASTANLRVLLRDSARLLTAVADAEPAREVKRVLQEAAGSLEAATARVAAMHQTVRSYTTTSHAAGVPALVTPAAMAALTAVNQDLQALHQELAEQQGKLSQAAPCWRAALRAVAEAASRSAMQGTAPDAGDQTAAEGPGSLVDVAQAFSDGLEVVIRDLLLWAQAAKTPSRDSDEGESQEQDLGDAEVAGKPIGQLATDLEGRIGPGRLDTLNSSISSLLSALAGSRAPLEGGALSQHTANCIAQLRPLLALGRTALRGLVLQLLTLHKATAKLGYISASLFAGLLQEGFCTAEETPEEGGDGAGGNFQEASGTGMGEGEGAKDVSDQLENEDQLLGSKQKDAPEEEKDEDQLPADDEAKGIEMEADFEGALGDIPPGESDESDEDAPQEGEERLQQEMGDVGDTSETVDERLWGDEDKPEEGQNAGEEKYERDAPVQVEDKTDLEYQAGQEDTDKDAQERPEGKGKKPQQKEKAAPDSGEGAEEEGGEENQGQEEGPVNEDTEDGYEDRQFGAPKEAEQELELPEDMALDGEDAGGEDEEEEAPQETEEAVNESGKFPEQPTPAEEVAPQQEGPPEQPPEDNSAEELMDIDEEAGDEGNKEEGAQGDSEHQAPAESEAGKEDTEPTGGRGEDEEQQQEQLPEAGPAGLPSAAVIAAQAEQGAGEEGSKPEDIAVGEKQAQPQASSAMDKSAQESGPNAQQDTSGAATGSREGMAAAAPQAADKSSECQARPDQSNPYRSLGDALERWRAQLNVEDTSGAENEAPEDAPGGKQAPGDEAPAGEYEFLPEGQRQQQGDTQTLAPATEEQAATAEAPDLGAAEEGEGAALDQEEEEMPDADTSDQRPADQVLRSGAKVGAGQMMDESADEATGKDTEDGKDDPDEAAEGGSGAEREVAADSFAASLLQHDALPQQDAEDSLAGGHYPGTDLAPEEAAAIRAQMDLALQRAAGGTLDIGGDAEYGRQMWARCEALTAGLAGELTEQLRLLLEPTRASRLAGDFRSGKRISMRKVVAYIASHFRKDKIWLRRTRPDKRQYQVVIAIDDSRSMAENSCGTFAMEAVSLLARALGRLEVGELSVVRFGGAGATNPLHPLDRPFTEADGPRVLSQLRFDQNNTIADRPMVELLTSLTHMLDSARQRMAGGSLAPQLLHQLVLILADGRFHEKESLRRVVAETAAKQGVLLAFIVLDNPASSLLDMQTVSFASGQPIFNKYLDSFPFPFYIVLRDIGALPRTLADLLRQWIQLSTA